MSGRNGESNRLPNRRAECVKALPPEGFFLFAELIYIFDVMINKRFLYEYLIRPKKDTVVW